MVTSDHTHHRVKRLVNLILLAVIVLFVLFLVRAFRPANEQLAQKIGNPQVKTINLRLKNVRLQVTIARTEAERAAGLSNRPNLGEFEGLLFVFPNDTRPAFWMKEMLFPIDIFWINQQMKIVSITKRLSPDSFPDTVAPPQPVRYVIETNAGLADDFNLQVGDSLGF